MTTKCVHNADTFVPVKGEQRSLVEFTPFQKNVNEESKRPHTPTQKMEARDGMEWVQKNKDGIGTVCLEWRGELERCIACAQSNTCCPCVLSVCCYVDTYCPSATHIFLLIFLFCPSLTTVAVISVLFLLTIFILILRSKNCDSENNRYLRRLH